ncbi:MAG: hypothetical protein LBS12_05655 [Prevotellaceae bacterium]|jgi:hypothetical protein|nr:hypothetical protein [Prevotellaceae bacterium]
MQKKYYNRRFGYYNTTTNSKYNYDEQGATHDECVSHDERMKMNEWIACGHCLTFDLYD